MAGGHVKLVKVFWQCGNNTPAARGEQLQWAAREARILVTRNRDDFILLTVERFRTGEAHPGVLIVPRSLPNDQPERIAHALAAWAARAAGAETLAYVIDFLGAV